MGRTHPQSLVPGNPGVASKLAGYAPGTYTAQTMSSSGGSAGTVLLEIYEGP